MDAVSRSEDLLAEKVEGAQSALSSAVAKANLMGDPLGQALEAMSQSLGAQLALHQTSSSHFRSVNQRLDLAVADAILRATSELEQRRESVVHRLAPELAKLTANSVASRDRAVTLKTALMFGGFAIALGLGVGAAGYGAGWKAGRAEAGATGGALAGAIQQAGPDSEAALVDMVRSNNVADAWQTCRRAAQLDKSGRKVCVMPMWAEPEKQPSRG